MNQYNDIGEIYLTQEKQNINKMQQEFDMLVSKNERSLRKSAIDETINISNTKKAECDKMMH